MVITTPVCVQEQIKITSLCSVDSWYRCNMRPRATAKESANRLSTQFSNCKISLYAGIAPVSEPVIGH